MSVINFYSQTKTKKTINPNEAIHGIKVNSRIVFAAPSGAGKSNGCLNMIYLFNKTFHEIIYCIKSADEPLIGLLEERLKNVIIYEGGEVPPLSSFSIKDEHGRLKRKDTKQRLIIFDDLLLDKAANKEIALYYLKGRKLGFTSCYISQSYYQIPKIIRDNCQYFILGRNLLKKDLRSILTVFPTEMSLDQFSNYYNELTKDEMSFITIDIEKRIIRPNFTGDAIKL